MVSPLCIPTTLVQPSVLFLSHSCLCPLTSLPGSPHNLLNPSFPQKPNLIISLCPSISQMMSHAHPENCVKYTCKFTLLGPKAPHDLASLISSSSTDAKAILLFTQTCCPHSLYGFPPTWNSLPLLLPWATPLLSTSSKKPSLTSVSSTDHPACFFFINFLAALALCCCMQAFSSCSEQNYSWWWRAAHCGAVSCCRAQVLSMWAPAAAAHGPSCLTACSIFPDLGLNPRPPHWQADSHPLDHQEVPTRYLRATTMLCTILCFPVMLH